MISIVGLLTSGCEQSQRGDFVRAEPNVSPRWGLRKREILVPEACASGYNMSPLTGLKTAIHAT